MKKKLIVAIGFLTLGSAMPTRAVSNEAAHTVETLDAQNQRFALKIHGCDGVTFQIPPTWFVSHWPEGGIAGSSAFFNKQQPGAILLVDGRLQSSIATTTSQETLYALVIAQDRTEEKDRLAENERIAEKMQRTIQQQPPTYGLRSIPRRPSDLAVIKKVAEERTADGRRIQICHWRSPIRGEWLEALIPGPGFLISVQFHGELSDDDIKTLRFVVRSYKQAFDPN